MQKGLDERRSQTPWLEYPNVTFIAAMVYYDGIGVEKDLNRVLEYYGKGAMLGDQWCKNKIKSVQSILQKGGNK